MHHFAIPHRDVTRLMAGINGFVGQEQSHQVIKMLVVDFTPETAMQKASRLRLFVRGDEVNGKLDWRRIGTHLGTTVNI